MNTTLIIVAIFVGFLIVAIASYFQKFYRPLMKAADDIKNLTERLNANIANVNTFEGIHRFCVEHFEDINNECLKSDAVRFIWNDFRKSLIRYKTDKVEKIYSASDAAEYFSYRNFTRGMNMTFWNGYGGIFTGLGILGTFIGLTVGLHDIDMANTDIEVLKTAIASLLSGVQFAFLTSLLGIFFAILYGPVHNRNVNKLKKRVRTLALLMERMFPRRTAEDWLHRNFVESEEQTKALRNIGADVAEAIYAGFDDHFNAGIERLCDQIEEKIAPFFGDIQTALNNLNVGFGDAVGRVMSEQAGSQMQNFARTLDNFTVNLQQSMISSQKFSAEMNANILSTLEEVRRTLKESAEENKKQMKSATELFQSIVDKQNEAMKQYHNSLLELEESTKNVLNEVKESASMIGQAAEPLQQSAILLKECLNQTEQATMQLHDEIFDRLNVLIEADKQSKDNIDRLLTGLNEYERSIKRAWLNYESNFDRVGGELEKATDIITERLQKYNEMMNGSMRDALTDFDKSMSNAIGLLQSIAEDLQDAADDLKKERRAQQ